MKTIMIMTEIFVFIIILLCVLYISDIKKMYLPEDYINANIKYYKFIIKLTLIIYIILFMTLYIYERI